MYKKQMILQRITSFLLLAAAVLVFVYSLGLLTDLYDSLYLVSSFPADEEFVYVEGATIYLEMQDFNKQLTSAGLILILSAVSLFVFRTHDRRKYYIANYVTIGVNAILNIVVAVWMRTEVLNYKKMFQKIDYDRLYAIAHDLFRQDVTDSTFWFDVSQGVFVVLIAVTVLSILNLGFKIALMIGEHKLLNEGKEQVYVTGFSTQQI